MQVLSLWNPFNYIYIYFFFFFSKVGEIHTYVRVVYLEQWFSAGVQVDPRVHITLLGAHSYKIANLGSTVVSKWSIE